MPSDSSSFVDPSALSLPSPQSDASDSRAASPVPSDNQPGPSRKRARTDMSPEERKEARAHRNRIAAQNSRDKRKAQFVALERRVAELEEENRQLRAGIATTDIPRPDVRHEERERERARERENAELKERIKSLEKGWETVMKVLAAQGLSNKDVSLPNTTSPKPESSPKPSSSPTTTFPVLVPSSPVFPITPSPSLSAHSSFFDIDEPMQMSIEPTRHLARVATAAAIPPAAPLQRTDAIAHPVPPTNLTLPLLSVPATFSAPTVTSLPSTSAADDAAVDAWIREIFIAGSPTLSTSALPARPRAEQQQEPETSAVSTSAPASGASLMSGSLETVSQQDWENEVEMQRLLDLLPAVPSNGDVDQNIEVDVSTALGLELCSDWNFSQDSNPASLVSLQGVDVF